MQQTNQIDHYRLTKTATYAANNSNKMELLEMGTSIELITSDSCVIINSLSLYIYIYSHFYKKKKLTLKSKIYIMKKKIGHYKLLSKQNFNGN
jgi:hypothetical protein